MGRDDEDVDDKDGEEVGDERGRGVGVLPDPEAEEGHRGGLGQGQKTDREGHYLGRI